MSTPKNGKTNHITPQALAIRTEVPFDKEILKFLLEHQSQIASPIVRDFVRRYVDWLYRCANEDTQVQIAGGKSLCRWEKENASYGYDPTDVSYSLYKLNQLFFMVMGNAYIRTTQQELEKDLPPLNTHLSMELLSGLSCPLGFYVLVRYFQTDAHALDKAWAERACDLFGELMDLETWRPHRDAIEQSGYVRQLLGTAVAVDEPYYNTATPGNIRDSRPVYKLQYVPASPYAGNSYTRNQDEDWRAGYNNGHYAGYQQCLQETSVLFNRTDMIIEAERKRLVDFLKSLRQTLDILNDDPLLVESQSEVVAKPYSSANGHHEGEV